MSQDAPEQPPLEYEADAGASATFNRDADGEFRIRCPGTRDNATSFLLLMISRIGAAFAALMAILYWIAG